MKKNAYRISVDQAKKFITLSNHCTKEVDDAFLELENEFGEYQPVKKSFVVGNGIFQNMQATDQINSLEEFAVLKRNDGTGKSKCTQKGMTLRNIFWLILFVF